MCVCVYYINVIKLFVVHDDNTTRQRRLISIQVEWFRCKNLSIGVWCKLLYNLLIFVLFMVMLWLLVFVV